MALCYCEIPAKEEIDSLNWQLKSAIQRLCAALPAGQEAAYYWLQRQFGALRHPADPTQMWEATVEIVTELRGIGFEIRGARVLEVGTGRRIDMPLGLYLCGAGPIVTVDLHPYLKAELLMQSVAALRRDRDRIRQIFLPAVPASELDPKLDRLAQIRDAAELMREARIDYRAPADAAQTGLPAASIDLQISYTVFEHIPRPVLAAILNEGSRVLSPDGVACHHIDPSDHFSHDDKSISAINFLRFNDIEWAHRADNQFAYHNRMRVTDFEALYRECHQEILAWDNHIDSRSLQALNAAFPLAPHFQMIPAEILATTIVRAISRPARPRDYPQ